MKRWLFLLGLLALAAWWWQARLPAPDGSEPSATEIARSTERSEPPPEPPAPLSEKAPVSAAGQAAPPAPPSTGPGEQDFSRLFDRLDACELLTQGVASRAPPEKVALLLFRRTRFIPADSEIGRGDVLMLFRILGTDSLDALMKDEIFLHGLRPPLKFFMALFAADLIRPRLVTKPDPALAQRLLEDAATASPANGAFYLFQAGVRLKAGVEERYALPALELAMRRGRFDTYLMRMARLIWEAGLSDTKLFVLSLALINRLPHPAYDPAFSTLSKRVTAQDPSWTQRALSFGELLMRGGRQEGNLPSNVYWRKEEYDLGRGLARKAWLAMNPGRNPSVTDAAWPPSSSFQGEGRLNPFDSRQFPPRHEGSRECDLEGFRRYLSQLARVSR